MYGGGSYGGGGGGWKELRIVNQTLNKHHIQLSGGGGGDREQKLDAKVVFLNFISYIGAGFATVIQNYFKKQIC